jgi:hypothetical protein
MVVRSEESLLIISVLQGAILLERAAVALPTILADLAMWGCARDPIPRSAMTAHFRRLS